MKFKYNYIYQTIKNLFDFEAKYSNYIKNVIEILVESEKRGDIFIDVDKYNPNFESLEIGWPNKHIEALENSRLVNYINCPFIFKNRRLFWHKWYKNFEDIKNELLKKIHNKKDTFSLSSENYMKSVKNIFKFSDLILIEGGPGTGKTTLIIEIITNLLKDSSILNIGLAAPTGKATSRLKDSIDESVLKKDGKSFLIECQTLNKWIDNSRYSSGEFKYTLQELDILIIDEMSMVNFDLFEYTLKAISSSCKLFLVGDSNQLPPVNSCSIWNYLFDESEKKYFKNITLNLQKVYRNSGDIISLSKTVLKKSNFLLIKEINRIKINDSNIKIYESNDLKIPKIIINIINKQIDKLSKSVSKLSSKEYIFNHNLENLLDYEEIIVNEIMNNLKNNLVLCQKNRGAWSVNSINEVILKKKEPYNLMQLQEGIPIMCTKNNRELGLSNGDIGVLIGKKEKRKFLFRKFNKDNKSIITLIDPKALDDIVPAIALTIHKSQGSESKRVLVLWKNTNYNLSNYKPTENNPILCNGDYERRLLYTAITRAREQLDLYFLN